MHMLVTAFYKIMNPTTILALITVIVVSTSVIMGGTFFVSNNAFAASCKTVHKQVVCKTSPHEFCTHYGADRVACTTRNFHNMISTS